MENIKKSARIPSTFAHAFGNGGWGGGYANNVTAYKHIWTHTKTPRKTGTDNDQLTSKNFLSFQKHARNARCVCVCVCVQPTLNYYEFARADWITCALLTALIPSENRRHKSVRDRK